MSSIKEQAVSVVHLQDNTSAALSNGAMVLAATNNFDNTSNLAFGATVRLATNGWGATTGIVGTTIDLYAIPKTDGTNFGTCDTSTPKPPLGQYKGSFYVSKTDSIQYIDVEGIALGPYLYEFAVLNSTGQQLSAGWKLDIFGELVQTP